MKKHFVSIILLIISINIFAQHWEMPQRFPILGENPRVKEILPPSNPPLIYKSKYSPLAKKGNCQYIDTLYPAKEITFFYDVNDFDSAYYVSGYTYNNRISAYYDPNNPTLLVRMKIDYCGNVIWQKVDSLMHGDHYTMRNTSLIQLSDGDFLQMGSVRNDYANWKNYDSHAAAYTKFNSNGDTIWQKLYVDTIAMHSGDWPMDIVAEDDGGFTVAALLGSDSKTYSTDTLIDYWYCDSSYVGLIRYDCLGNIIQRKKHFVGGAKVPITIGLIMKQSDGGYIVGGVNYFLASNKLNEYYLFKTDSLFNWQWVRKFGQIARQESLIKIIPKINNEYYFSVLRADTPIVIDMYGDKWYNGYHHLGIMDSLFFTIKDTVFCINLALADSATSTYWKSNGKTVGADTSLDGKLLICSRIDPGVGSHLMSIDKNLNYEWGNWIADYPYFTEEPKKMRRAHDGGYLIVGMTYRFGIGGWFVKTDTNGFALPNCADTLYHIGVKELDSDSHQNNKPLVIYPNPASDVFYLSVDDKEFSKSIMEIYDLTGRIKHRQMLNFGSNSINIQELSSGMYLVRIKSLKGKIQTGKLIVK